MHYNDDMASICAIYVLESQIHTIDIYIFFLIHQWYLKTVYMTIRCLIVEPGRESVTLETGLYPKKYTCFATNCFKTITFDSLVLFLRNCLECLIFEIYCLIKLYSVFLSILFGYMWNCVFVFYVLFYWYTYCTCLSL